MSKLILTTRCTTIETFRQWIECGEEDDKPWLTEAGVISNIQGIETYNVEASFGTAGHSIIEDAPRYKTDTGYVVKDFEFSDTQVQPLLKHRSEHPLWVREVALSKLYSTPNFDLIITGTTDAVEGITLRDTKFKFSSFDISDFVSSFQWRCYLDMIGLDIFWYDFFKVKNFSSMEDMPKAVIQDCESMMLKRYAGMDNDIAAVINELADFVTFKQLLPHLVITDAKRKRIAAGDPKLLKLI